MYVDKSAMTPDTKSAWTPTLSRHVQCELHKKLIRHLLIDPSTLCIALNLECSANNETQCVDKAYQLAQRLFWIVSLQSAWRDTVRECRDVSCVLPTSQR